MPQSLEDHAAAISTKMLFIGDTGAGKTGALAPLAAAGYHLRILDMDNGLDALRNIILHSRDYGGRESLKRITYETLTDARKNVAGKLIPAKAKAWSDASALLSHWKMPEREINGRVLPAYDLGPVSSWGPDVILVIDSLTMLAKAAFNWTLAMNGRLGRPPEQSDWFQGQQRVEEVCAMLFDEGIRCNVIMIGHISYIGTEGGVQRGYPATLGKALSPHIGRYFNTILAATSTGSGQNVKRVIKTDKFGTVELKNIAPMKVPAEYPQATGLAQYFKDVQDSK